MAVRRLAPAPQRQLKCAYAHRRPAHGTTRQPSALSRQATSAGRPLPFGRAFVAALLCTLLLAPFPAWGATQQLGDFSVTTEATMPTYASGLLTVSEAGTYQIAMAPGVSQTGDTIAIGASSGSVELVLQDVDISSTTPVQGVISSPSSSVDVTLTLQGNSSLVNMDATSPYPEGMDVAGNLTIGGSGSLYVNAAEGNVYDYAIYAAQSPDTSVTLKDSAQVQAGSGDPANSPRYGMLCTNLVVQDNATLVAHGRQYGAFARHDITLQGGSVTTSANGLDITSPFQAAERPANFFDEPTASSGYDTIPFSAIALCSFGGLTISGGPVTATGSASNVDSFGIISNESMATGDVVVYGEGETMGILVIEGSLTANIVSTGVLEGIATSADGVGIAASGGITYGDPATILVPDQGRVIASALPLFPDETFSTIAAPDSEAPVQNARIAVLQPDPPVPPEPQPEPQPEPSPLPGPDAGTTPPTTTSLQTGQAAFLSLAPSGDAVGDMTILSLCSMAAGSALLVAAALRRARHRK